MSITIIPGSHEPKTHPKVSASTSLEEFLLQSCPDPPLPQGLQVGVSSFKHPDQDSASKLYPSSSSFVRSAIEAWGRHSHLVIRPDDVLFTIMVQLNFYMEQNYEKLRHLFVTHPGREELVVFAETWDLVFDRFRDKVQENIKTPWLREWISPGFSTSTLDDERTANVLMMGLMKGYFDFAGGIICGIPSITLLGEKRDWQRLLDKAERLGKFGEEPAAYGRRLRPLLQRIVSTFDNPSSAKTRDFWDQMVQAKVRHSDLCGAPPTQYILSGWILGFFFWSREGHVNERLANGLVEYRGKGELLYDGVRYGTSPLEDIPIGYARLPFRIIKSPEVSIKAWLLAGSIGKSITDGAPPGYADAIAGEEMNEKYLRSGNHSTIQPRSGWILSTPQDDPAPSFERAEVSGPTVEAIDSCPDTLHWDAEY